MIQHSFVHYQDRSSSPQKVFHYSKADWDSLQNFFATYPWYSGFSKYPSSFANFISKGIQHGMDLSIRYYLHLAKSLIQRRSLHNVQKLSKIKNHHFTEWKLHKTPQAHNLCSKSHQSCQNLLFQLHQQLDGFISNRISFLLVLS